MRLFDPTFCSQSLPVEITIDLFFVQASFERNISDSVYSKSIKANELCQSWNTSRSCLFVSVPARAHISSLESNSRAFRRHQPIHTRIHLKKAKIAISS